MSYEHLVAGILGGLTSTIVLHPLDLLKVRFAVSDGQSEVKKSYKNISNAFRTIVRDEGFKGLYKGVAPNCLGAGTAWGLYFLFYNSAKKHMLDSSHDQHLGPLRHMAAGACAGALTTAITNPIWVVKTRLCLQYGEVTTGSDAAPTKQPVSQQATTKTSKIRTAAKENSLPESRQYSGTWDALKKVYKYEGVTGLYRGFVPGLLGVSHGAVQLATYEEMKKFYLQKSNLPPDHNLGTIQYLTCAALSKLVAASITYPYQVVRARLQDQHVNYEGVFDVVKKTWRFLDETLLKLYSLSIKTVTKVVDLSSYALENSTHYGNEGLVGFYKGLRPSLLRVVPASMITFLIYEQSLILLKGQVR